MIGQTRPRLIAMAMSGLVLIVCAAEMPMPVTRWMWAVPAAVVLLSPLLASVAWQGYRHARATESLVLMSRPARLGGLSARELPAGDGAFVAGLFRPSIFYGRALAGELTRAEVDAVLLHERYHQLDHAPAKLVMLMGLAPAIRWFAAGRAWLSGRLARLEIDADRHVLAAGVQRSVLASAILKVKPMAGSMGIGFASAADQRLRALLEEEPTRSAAFPLPYLLLPALIALGCWAALAIH